MKKLTGNFTGTSKTLAGVLAGAVAFACTLSTAHAADTYRIGFSYWKAGKIYEEAVAGIKDGLELEGIKYEEVAVHADKDKAKAEENLRKLDAMGVDVIYSLSSAGTKIAKGLELKTPVVATVINHPASLGVGQENTATSTKLTGTSYYVDAAEQLELYSSLFPNLKKVGMIFDVNNPAGALAEEPFMKRACQEARIEFVSVGVKEKSELKAAAEKLVEAGVDTVVVPTNRLVYANLSIVQDVLQTKNIPTVSMNKQGVENGALAALFADTYNLGRLTAPMVKQIVVEKKNAAELDFTYVSEPDIILNLTAAEELGFEFPAEVLGSAAIVMQ